MSYREDESVRVNRLHDERLEELARIRLKIPTLLLWLADRLLVIEWNADQKSDSVTEFELSATRL